MHPVDAVLNNPDLRIGILSHVPPKYPRQLVDFGSYLVDSACVSKAWNADAKIAKQIWVERDFVPFHTYGGLETAHEMVKFISERKFVHLNFSEEFCFDDMVLPNMRMNDFILRDIVKVCSNLRSLNLSMTHITDEVMRKIFKHAPHLNSLILSNTEISNDGFLDIRPNEKLESLDLRCCYSIWSVGLQRIFKIFLHLKSLDLSGICLGDEQFVNFGQLQCLNIRNNQGINDLGINHILEKCSLGLQMLNIAENIFVTSAGIRAILNKCKNLKTLHVTEPQTKRVDFVLAAEKKIKIVIEESACDGRSDEYFRDF